MRWFKNMKIRSKMLIGYMIVTLLAGGIGVFGISRVISINEMDTKLYSENVKGIEAISTAQIGFMKNRMETRNLMLSEGKDKTGIYTNMEANFLMTDEALVQYGDTIVEDLDRTNYEQLKELLANFRTDMTAVINAYKAGKSNEEITAVMNKGMNNTVAASDMLTTMILWNEEQAKERSDANSKAAKEAILIMSIIVVASMAVAILLGFGISNLISRPIKNLEKASEMIALGDVDVDIRVESRDEIGNLATAFKRMVDGIQAQVKVIESIADGDMTAEITMRSEDDIMNKKLSELLNTNNQIFGEIRSSADQVESASGQVAAGSQIMAQGATEQASTVEEINASIEELATQSRENANNSRKANELAEKAQIVSAEGAEKMRDMMKSMEDINESSGSISKIIKVIDEIAFQTNILALNAAVEAARAGAHGKGFAVVAEEVRNLAAKSSEAAKETAELIASTIRKSEHGTEIAKGTSVALKNIMELVVQVASTIDAISDASNEQAAAISQISQAIDQVTITTQTNSATAEESASASEELSAQAMMLKESVARFQLKNSEAELSHWHSQEFDAHPKSYNNTSYTNKTTKHVYGKY